MTLGDSVNWGNGGNGRINERHVSTSYSLELGGIFSLHLQDCELCKISCTMSLGLRVHRCHCQFVVMSSCSRSSTKGRS